MKYITYADNTAIPLLHNLIASMSKNCPGMKDSLVVYSFDQNTHEWCSNIGKVESVSIPAIVQTNLFKNWATVDFGKMMLQKFGIVLDVLKRENDFVLLDTDIVFLRDPTEYHKQRANADNRSKIIFQNSLPDSHPYCGGYYQVVSKNKEDVKSVFSLFEQCHKEAMIHTPLINDQHVISNLINAHSYGREPHEFKIILSKMVYEFFPIATFPDGRVYFDWKKSDNAFMVHNNFIVGLDAKIQRFKHYGLWYAN